MVRARTGSGHGVVADRRNARRGKSSYHAFIKRSKNRHERRRAKAMPDCQPGYGRYSGYES